LEKWGRGLKAEPTHADFKAFLDANPDFTAASNPVAPFWNCVIKASSDCSGSADIESTNNVESFFSGLVE